MITIVMAERTRQQREQVVKRYHELYRVSLVGTMDWRLEGSFRTALLMLCNPRESIVEGIHSVLLAKSDLCIRYLLDIIRNCSREELDGIKQSYESKYMESLDDSLRKHPETNKTEDIALVRSILQDDYTPKDVVNSLDLARRDVKFQLNMMGDNGEAVLHVIRSRSYYQEQISTALFRSTQIHNDSIHITTIAEDIANSIYQALTGVQDLNFVIAHAIITRCEVDMIQVKQAFHDMFQSTVSDAIKDNSCGSFRDVLLSLCGEPQYGR